MSPATFKVVAKSPAALKSKFCLIKGLEFKHDLKLFREEMSRKK